MQRCTLETLDAGVPCRTPRTTWPWKRRKLKSLKIGNVVNIHSEEKNRGKWPLGIVEQLYGVIRAVKLRTGKSILERPMQHLYPLEMSCDDPENVARPSQLDAQAPVFRPRRDAALAARIRFRDVLQDEELRKPSYPP